MSTTKFVAIISVIFPIWGICGQIPLTSPNGLSYYMLCENPMTWNEANLECMKHDLTLVTLDSKEKIEDLLNLYNQTIVGIGDVFPENVDEDTKIWSGGVGTFPEFSWNSNGRPIIPSLWYNSIPTDEANSNCVYLKFSKTIPYYGLGNLDCKQKNVAFCENRIEHKKCCIKKQNVLLQVSQNGL